LYAAASQAAGRAGARAGAPPLEVTGENRGMQDLPGKTAFVTGGASGIGLGIAKALLGAGMNVVIADIREDRLAAASAELGAPMRVLALKLDVTDRAAYARAADAAETRFRKIHLLCNNAGVAVVGPTELATFADWDWVLGVNLGGVINGIVVILPRILKHGEGGHIVNTSSMSGLVPHGGATIYGTSKGAVLSMMECMRPELESRGVICSAFCPGAVQSNIAEAGKTRPAALGESGYAEADKRRQQNTSFFHLFRTKEEVGERVLEGILNDELYIMTHSEFRQGVEERAQAMCAAVPELPENEEYKRTFSFLFRNPIHAAETARHKRGKT
jgi:NAD(P)-dependent dehydrogenase (short-subunit alcohol dehydrogenase family)